MHFITFSIDASQSQTILLAETLIMAVCTEKRKHFLYCQHMMIKLNPTVTGWRTTPAGRCSSVPDQVDDPFPRSRADGFIVYHHDLVSWDQLPLWRTSCTSHTRTCWVNKSVSDLDTLISKTESHSSCMKWLNSMNKCRRSLGHLE